MFSFMVSFSPYVAAQNPLDIALSGVDSSPLGNIMSTTADSCCPRGHTYESYRTYGDCIIAKRETCKAYTSEVVRAFIEQVTLGCP